jgi:hypothetical protein
MRRRYAGFQILIEQIKPKIYRKLIKKGSLMK